MEASVWVRTNPPGEGYRSSALKSPLFRFIPLLMSFLLLFGHWTVLAQEPAGQLKASVDATEITVGDVVTLSLNVQHPSSVKLAFPSFGNEFGEWVVRNVKSIPPKNLNNGHQEDGLQIQLAVYKTGEFEVPALEVELIKSSGERSVLVSQPIKIKVESVLTGQEQDLKGLKAQAEIRPDYLPFLFFLAALVFALFLLYRLIGYLRKRRKPGLMEARDTRTHEQIARDAIQALLSRKLVEQGFFKQFYLELSEISKRYLGRKLNILSLERTSEEFTRDLRKTSLASADFQRVREFLMDCDLVKFAKYHPSQEETQEILAHAFLIIDSVAASERDSRLQLEVPV